MKRLFMLLVILTIPLLFVTFWNSSRAVEDPMEAAGAFRFNEGIIAPDFLIETLNGDKVTLEDFRGKVVLLDFWATW
jgi:cytochrome oxidase Cu insertion factor (SCO1/SenC/PrrC family)